MGINNESDIAHRCEGVKLRSEATILLNSSFLSGITCNRIFGFMSRRDLNHECITSTKPRAGTPTSCAPPKRSQPSRLMSLRLSKMKTILR